MHTRPSIALSVALCLASFTASETRAGAPDAESPFDVSGERDPAIDHGLLSDHAETIGAGQWRLGIADLLVFRVSYGVTDDLQLSVTTSAPIPPLPITGLLTARYVAARDDAYVLAVRAMAGAMTTSWRDLGYGMGAFGAGPLLDVYFDDAQRFALHSGILIGDDFHVGFDDGDGPSLGSGMLILFEAGLSFAVSDQVKLLVETQWITDFKFRTGFDRVNLGMVNYGVRLHTPGFAFDLGMMRPIGDLNLSGWVLGYPFIAFTADL